MENKYHIDTLMVHDKLQSKDAFGSVVPPIYQNSLFTFDSWESIESAFDDKVNNSIYTRGNNPTVAIAEKKLAQLAGGEKAKLFASGMAAVSAAMLHFVRAGDHIITLKNTYGPSISLINEILVPKLGVSVSYVSGEDPNEIADAITEKTTLIYLESPSSVVFSLQDLEKVAQLAKQHHIATVIDNTWATPLYQKPLSFGIDLELHSCSKYLGGHSDIIAGALIGKTALIDDIIVKEYELLGAKMAPMEAWFLLRSLRTLELRMARHQQSAMLIASFLENHEKIIKVNYPGLKSFKQHQLAQRQMLGYSGLLSFQLATENLEQVKQFFNSLTLFQIGVSWGGHESLVYAPAISGLKEQTPEQFSAMGISLADIRLSIGLENAEDLITDLENALKAID